MANRLAILLLLFASVGCGAPFNTKHREVLSKRASFDMGCASSELEFVPLQTDDIGRTISYGIRGCGRQSTYVFDFGSGVWTLDGKSGAPPSAAPSSPTAAPPGP